MGARKNMELSNFLANIFGISIIAVSLSLLYYPKIIKKIFESMQNETTLFFTGVVSFVIGISMILTHNIWVYDWKVIVTILGWAILLKGVIRLFLPDMVMGIARKMKNSQWITFILVLNVIFGCVLIYFGFTA